MKKITFIIALFFSTSAFAQIEKVIPVKPNPPKLVNDIAGVLSQEQRDALEFKLDRYDDSTSNQIAVVTIKSTEDYEISEVALAILRKWGVGGSKNNGIVVLAAVDDHKVWISTGYGMEGVVPDITAKSIIDNDILPNFRQGNYYRGFDEAVGSIIKAAAGEYKAPEGYRSKSSGKGIGRIILGIIILIVILSSFGGGNRGGGYISRRGSGWLGPFILGSMLGRGSSGWSGGGSGWSGGGGGGFGGFGGGSGGGGGAGGSW